MRTVSQRIGRLVLAALLSLPAMVSAAIDAPSPCPTSLELATFSLDRVIRRAICESPELRSADASIQRARAVIREARSALRPQVAIDVGAQASDDRNGTDVNRSSALSSQLTVAQTIYDSGQTDARIRQRTAQAESEMWSAIGKYREVVLDVSGLLVSAASARARVDAAIESERISAESLAIVRARFSSGRATGADVLVAESALAESVRQRTSAEGDVRRYAGQLLRRLYLPDGDVELPSSDALRPPSSQRWPDGLDGMRALVQVGHPDLQAQRLRVDAADQQVAFAKAQSDWTVGWNASLGPKRQWSTLPTVIDRAVSGTIALTFTRPLSDGGSREARLQQAVADAQGARAAEASLQLTIERDLFDRWTRLRQADDSRKASQVAYAAAQAAAAARRGQYAAGGGSLTELLNAQTDLANRQQQYVGALYEYRAAEIALACLLGALDPPEAAVPPATR